MQKTARVRHSPSRVEYNYRSRPWHLACAQDLDLAYPARSGPFPPPTWAGSGGRAVRDADGRQDQSTDGVLVSKLRREVQRGVPRVALAQARRFVAVVEEQLRDEAGVSRRGGLVQRGRRGGRHDSQARQGCSLCDQYEAP